MRRLTMTRELATWLKAKVMAAGALFLDSAHGAALIQQLLPALETFETEGQDGTAWDVEDRDFDLWSVVIAPRGTPASPAELLAEARMREQFYKAVVLTGSDPAAWPSAPARVEVKTPAQHGLVHSGLLGSTSFGMPIASQSMAQVPFVPPDAARLVPAPAVVNTAVEGDSLKAIARASLSAFQGRVPAQVEVPLELQDSEAVTRSLLVRAQLQDLFEELAALQSAEDTGTHRIRVAELANKIEAELGELVKAEADVAAVLLKSGEVPPGGPSLPTDQELERDVEDLVEGVLDAGDVGEAVLVPDDEKRTRPTEPPPTPVVTDTNPPPPPAGAVVGVVGTVHYTPAKSENQS